MEFLELKELGIAGVSVGAVVFVVIKFLAHLKDSDDRNSNIHNKFNESINANTKVTNETYLYLKNRNGTLEQNDNRLMEQHAELMKQFAIIQEKDNKLLNKIKKL